MKNTLLILCAIALCGCSTSYLSETKPDKSRVRAFNSRFIWSTEGFEATKGSNGVAIKIQKSNPDAVTAAAVTDAAVKSAISSAKP